MQTNLVSVHEELNVLHLGLHEVLPHGVVDGPALRAERPVAHVEGQPGAVARHVVRVVVLGRVRVALPDFVVVLAPHGTQEHAELVVPNLSKNMGHVSWMSTVVH